MKPSCRIVLNLLRDHDSVTTHDFLAAGAGSRFGARIGELRKLGYVIDERRLPLPTRGSRYTLVGEPDVGRESAAVAHPLRGTAAALSPSAGAERADVHLERDQEHRGTQTPRDNGVGVGSLNFDGALFDAERFGRAA